MKKKAITPKYPTCSPPRPWGCTVVVVVAKYRERIDCHAVSAPAARGA
jgi:hypothetical protein